MQAGVDVLWRHDLRETKGRQESVSDLAVMQRLPGSLEKLHCFNSYLVAFRVPCHVLPSVRLLDQPIETLELSNATILA
jgi:hypothetical protein